MEHFRTTVSQLWRKQHSTDDLNQAFKKVIDSGVNWSVMDQFDPVMADEAKVNDNGMLVLSGYYPTKPSQVYFEQKYVYEGLSWKLIGFKIEAK